MCFVKYKTRKHFKFANTWELHSNRVLEKLLKMLQRVKPTAKTQEWQSKMTKAHEKNHRVIKIGADISK